MNCEELKLLWKNEEKVSFKGWNFSYLKGRWDDEALPWNYDKVVRKYLRKEFKLLDMGTGGGEYLLTLNHPYKNTAVTESWEPNVKLCEQKLAPLGIEVRQVFDDHNLPFDDNTFDIVINRHESFDLDEIKRILKPKGIFITQQVGGKNNRELSKFLIENFEPQFTNNTLDIVTEEMKQRSFNIIYKNEYYPYLRFYDVGALVYFAKRIEWEFPNFSVDNCFDKLLELNEQLKTNDYIESKEHRFIIVGQKIE